MSLIYSPENIAKIRPEDKEKSLRFCEGYKKFLDEAKTEREAVHTIIGMAKEQGYSEFEPGRKYLPGEKGYFNNRKKSMILFTMGKKPLSDGCRFNIAHIDCPRLDLKPLPLYENEELAYFKTHYYGGIRKYQWVATPLSMHGAVCLTDGRTIEISYGEKDDEPKFYISDLLPHLSAKQNERTLKEGIRGEELNIIVGSTPAEGAEKDAYREAALQILHEKFGFTEADFRTAELEFVPAVKATDIGLDRMLVGGYGQDDRVCAYTAIMAAFTVTDPEYTTVTVLTDKEEIGSYGVTGMDSSYVLHFVEDLCEPEGIRVRDVFRKSVCISSDVSAAYDPTFSDVFEKENSSFLGHGPALIKYTGARGKSGASDASAELMAKVAGILDREGVIWQTGELGKVDEGGGGTIALYMASNDVETVDLGVPVLAMHSPFEVTSKLDVYHTYLAFSAIYR